MTTTKYTLTCNMDGCSISYDVEIDENNKTVGLTAYTMAGSKARTIDMFTLLGENDAKLYAADIRNVMAQESTNAGSLIMLHEMKSKQAVPTVSTPTQSLGTVVSAEVKPSETN